MAASDKTTKIHQGRNVKRFREMQGIKQESMAYALGEEWSQKKISLLEGQEIIEQGLLEQVAKILKITPEVIKNFDDETAVNIISNTFTDFKDNASGINYNCNLNFNPLDKLMQAFDELKTALSENKNLYERLLASEQEKIEILKKATS